MPPCTFSCAHAATMTCSAPNFDQLRSQHTPEALGASSRQRHGFLKDTQCFLPSACQTGIHGSSAMWRRQLHASPTLCLCTLTLVAPLLFTQRTSKLNGFFGCIRRIIVTAGPIHSSQRRQQCSASGSVGAVVLLLRQCTALRTR